MQDRPDHFRCLGIACEPIFRHAMCERWSPKSVIEEHLDGSVVITVEIRRDQRHSEALTTWSRLTKKYCTVSSRFPTTMTSASSTCTHIMTWPYTLKSWLQPFGWTGECQRDVHIRGLSSVVHLVLHCTTLFRGDSRHRPMNVRRQNFINPTSPVAFESVFALKHNSTDCSTMPSYNIVVFGGEVL